MDVYAVDPRIKAAIRATADKVKPCFLARVAAVRASAIICVIFSSGRADQAFGGAWRGSEACVLAAVRRVYPRPHLKVSRKSLPDSGMVGVPAQRRAPVERRLTGCPRRAA